MESKVGEDADVSRGDHTWLIWEIWGTKGKKKVTWIFFSFFSDACMHACRAFVFTPAQQLHIQDGSQHHPDLHAVKWRPHACPWT